MSETKPTTLDVEALTRLDLKPEEILAVTVGQPNLTPVQLEMFGEYVADWLDTHGMPVAGVLVLPPGSKVQAIAAAFVAAHVEASPLPPGRYTPEQVAEHHKQH